MSVQARGWDCHAHVFGPYARFPLAARRSYTPPEATLEQHAAHLARLGLRYGVLVQGSAYGDDHGLLLHALATHAHLRGVVVVQPGTRCRLAVLREQGVRAARFSHRSGVPNFAGSASFDDLLALAGPLADAGLHAELWTDCAALPAIAARLRDLPLPVVIDHMGGFDAAAGVADAGFQTLCALLADGKVWVKLCVYRCLLGQPDLRTGRAFHQALLNANPGHLLWGSDWPHLRVEPAPDAVALLDLCRAWTEDAALMDRILAHNAAYLYT